MAGHKFRSAVISTLPALWLAAAVDAAQDSSASKPCEGLGAGTAAVCSEETIDTPVSQDSRSGSLDDSDGTIASSAKALGLNPAADLRGGYSYTNHDHTDGGDDANDVWLGRFRAGGSYNFSDWLIVGGRVATACSSTSCRFDFTSADDIPIGATSLRDGDVTFDELYLHSFRREYFDLAFGRLQTKFVSRAGVFAKSLDRNDSNGTSITWTDGIHGTAHLGDSAILHLILQKNHSDGTGNVRRAPIDFGEEDSRVSYFLAWENLRALGNLTQRGIDVTFMPNSLMQDGTASGRIADYITWVTRYAASWPRNAAGPQLTLAGELGYAPTTPTRAAMGLPGAGDSGGLAWNITVSGMNLRPNHSIGLNYGQTDAGWLISPDFKPNTQVVELRYLWRKSHELALDIRVRQESDLELSANASQKARDTNVFARFTRGFD
jgi:hypothetical protein